jgi:hypothetical protein
MQAMRHQQALLTEVADRGLGRADPSECGEEDSQGFLHLTVGVQDHPVVWRIDEADRQPDSELAPAGLVQDAASKPGS